LKKRSIVASDLKQRKSVDCCYYTYLSALVVENIRKDWNQCKYNNHC